MGEASRLAAAQISTNETSANAVISLVGGSVTLNGTTILTTGNGSSGLDKVAAGTSLTATDVNVITHGAMDSSDGFIAFGAYNGSNVGAGFPGAGTMILTDTTIATTGIGAIGVETNSGGMTTISGGSVTTSGANALGLQATGTASSITTSNGTTVSTGGLDANGVQADTGGTVTLTGGSVTTVGNGSSGLAVLVPAASMTASGVSVSISGEVDAATGNSSYGALNGPGYGFTAGGALNLTNSTISTAGSDSVGVYTGVGGTTTLTGTSVTTGGVGAAGVD